MRRNFAQVLREGKIDINKEYSKLYSLFYGINKNGTSDADYVSENIQSLHFCSTCLDLDEFDEMYGFNFKEQPQDFDIDYLVNFCEYIYNFAYYLKCDFINNFSFYTEFIPKIIDKIGYMFICEDQLTIFVPKDNAAIAVSESEMIPPKISYKLISYNHHSMKGDLQKKKDTILQLADLLEPKREELTKADKSLSRDLFYLFNNLNLRHNNTDPAGKSYKKAVADMAPEDLEQWYDETYQMCLLSFLKLEQAERKIRFDELKTKIEKK